MRTFKSLQHYLKVNGHPMPLILESIGDESQIEDFESKRYYVQLYEIKMQGYLLCEEDFEVVPAVTRNMTLLEVDDKITNVLFNKNIINGGTSIILNFVFRVNKNSITIPVQESATYNSVSTNNINSYNLSVNGVPVTVPFTINAGDEFGIHIVRVVNSDATISLNGLLS